MVSGNKQCFLGLTNDEGVSKSRVRASDGLPDLIDYSCASARINSMLNIANLVLSLPGPDKKDLCLWIIAPALHY